MPFLDIIAVNHGFDVLNRITGAVEAFFFNVQAFRMAT